MTLFSSGGIFDSDSLLVNPIPDLDNIVNYSDFTDLSKINFGTGLQISSVDRSLGTIDFSNLEITNTEYDPTYFGGRGGLKIVDADSDIAYGANFVAGAIQTFLMMVFIPDYVSNKSFWSVGDLAFGDSNARLLHNGIGSVSYGRDEVAGFPVLGTKSAEPVQVTIGLRYNSTASVDHFFDNPATTGNFDPNNVFSTAVRVWLGDRGSGSDGSPDFGFAEFLHTSDAMTDNEIANVVNYWRRKYRIV